MTAPAPRAQRWRALASMLCLAGAALASPAQAQAPATVEAASPEQHVGKVVLRQLVTPDLAVARRFYGGLLGWTFRDLQLGRTGYVEASADGHPVAGLIQRERPAGDRLQPAWLTFISVRDVDAARAVAVEKGARVLFEPRDVPGRGRQAVLADPQGAVFAVLASSAGDPPDELPELGEWIWSSLSTVDPDADAAFYQALFDYQVFELQADAGAQHLLLASDDLARASVSTLPVEARQAHPRWLSYVRVEDVAWKAALAVSLGGRVLVEPRLDRHGGKVAVVADPLGAPFGLLEWSDAWTKEVAK
jgi:predicted enzyme related to lactoylglutathione lyase